MSLPIDSNTRSLAARMSLSAEATSSEQPDEAAICSFRTRVLTWGEGHRNSDRARDLPIHESVLERTAHGRRGSNMPVTLLNARFLSLKHSRLG
jgi:hypothetical protein